VVDRPPWAVAGDEQGVVADPNDLAGLQDPVHRIVDRPPGRLVDDGEDLPEAPAPGLVLAPAGQPLGDRVDEADLALLVGGDDGVADPPEGRGEPPLALPDRRGGLLATVGLPPGRGDDQPEQRQGQDGGEQKGHQGPADRLLGGPGRFGELPSLLAPDLRGEPDVLQPRPPGLGRPIVLDRRAGPDLPAESVDLLHALDLPGDHVPEPGDPGPLDRVGLGQPLQHGEVAADLGNGPEVGVDLDPVPRAEEGELPGLGLLQGGERPLEFPQNLAGEVDATDVSGERGQRPERHDDVEDEDRRREPEQELPAGADEPSHIAPISGDDAAVASKGLAGHPRHRHRGHPVGLA